MRRLRDCSLSQIVLVPGFDLARASMRTYLRVIFVFTKDTLIGKNRFGDDLSRMSDTLDSTKKPLVMKLTVTKNFPGAKADAIVQIRGGKLHIC